MEWQAPGEDECEDEADGPLGLRRDSALDDHHEGAVLQLDGWGRAAAGWERVEGGETVDRVTPGWSTQMEPRWSFTQMCEARWMGSAAGGGLGARSDCGRRA